MRYNLSGDILVPVTKIIVDGMVYSNPTDEMIDNNHAGYPLVIDGTIPEYDPDTQYLVKSYRQEPDSIVEYNAVEEISHEAQIKKIDEEIAKVNAQFEIDKQSPVLYANDKYYLPCWASEYYAPKLLQDNAEYPTYVAAVDMSYDPMSKAELQSLYNFLVTKGEEIIAKANMQLAVLYAKRKELE